MTLRKIVLLVVFILVVVIVSAQPGGGPGGGGDPGNGNPVPISGLELLLGAGAFLGARKLKKMRNKKSIN